MKQFCITVILIFSAAAVFAQTSPVRLSMLEVSDIVDPASEDSNKLLVKFSASDPASLDRVEIQIVDFQMQVDRTVSLPVLMDEDNKTCVKVDQYKVPFERNAVRVFITVSKEPYSKVMLVAYDGEARLTNQLVYSSAN